HSPSSWVADSSDAFPVSLSDIWNPGSTARGCCVATSQSRTVRSQQLATSVLPSGVNCTDQTIPGCLSVPISAPLAASHSLTSPLFVPNSPAAVANSLPSGEKVTAMAPCAWAFSVDRSLPVPASQSLTVPSQQADATVLLSGLKVTNSTGRL